MPKPADSRADVELRLSRSNGRFDMPKVRVAEGVETQPQLERLQEMGCKQSQGYLFQCPISTWTR